VDKRIFSLENEYGVTCAFRGQRRLSPEEIARYLFGCVVSGDRSSDTLLKVGATDLVLRMIEAGTVMPELPLDNAISALGEVSRDMTGRSLLRLADGREMSALDIQREYLARAADFTGRNGADEVTRRVLRMWQRALEAIGTGNLDAIAREVDWVIKYQLIERYRARHDLPLSSPRVARLDLAYHDMHRGRGLYYLLQRNGEVDRAVRDVEIFEAKTIPPAHGRERQAG
jgi:proteasome accessory factor A